MQAITRCKHHPPVFHFLFLLPPLLFPSRKKCERRFTYEFPRPVTCVYDYWPVIVNSPRHAYRARRLKNGDVLVGWNLLNKFRWNHWYTGFLEFFDPPLLLELFFLREYYMCLGLLLISSRECCLIIIKN